MRESTDEASAALDVDTLRAALRQAPITRAILFGSYARGTERESSDVDVAVEFEDNLSSLERTRARLRLIESIGTMLGLDEVDVIPLASAPETLRAEIMEEGLVVVPTDDESQLTAKQPPPNDDPALDRFDDVLADLDGLV